MAAANFYASALAYVTLYYAYAYRTCKHPCAYACAYGYACVVRVNQALYSPTEKNLNFYSISQDSRKSLKYLERNNLFH